MSYGVTGGGVSQQTWMVSIAALWLLLRWPAKANHRLLVLLKFPLQPKVTSTPDMLDDHNLHMVFESPIEYRIGKTLQIDSPVRHGLKVADLRILAYRPKTLL
jgi:hypothetical protein